MSPERLTVNPPPLMVRFNDEGTFTVLVRVRLQFVANVTVPPAATAASKFASVHTLMTVAGPALAVPVPTIPVAPPTMIAAPTNAGTRRIRPTWLRTLLIVPPRLWSSDGNTIGDELTCRLRFAAEGGRGPNRSGQVVENSNNLGWPLSMRPRVGSNQRRTFVRRTGAGMALTAALALKIKPNAIWTPKVNGGGCEWDKSNAALTTSRR